MEYCLQCDGLYKEYHGFAALNGLTMNIERGAIYGFIGKNGAGKTTLIRIISGLQRPTSGVYSLFGENFNKSGIYKARRRMSAIVETPSVYADMTARDNLAQQCRMTGTRENRVDDILDFVGLRETGRKKAKDFSLGMRQRLGIAIALVGNPDFIVLDEPVNGLDPQGIVDFRELILRLNREKDVTFLISSHILDELSKVATHYGFIDRGHTVKEISAKELASTSRKCIYAETSDIATASLALIKHKIEYKVISPKAFEAYGAVSVQQLETLLANEACKVEKIYEKDESLESYYLRLIGGGDNV